MKPISFFFQIANSYVQEKADLNLKNYFEKAFNFEKTCWQYGDESLIILINEWMQQNRSIETKIGNKNTAENSHHEK